MSYNWKYFLKTLFEYYLNFWKWFKKSTFTFSASESMLEKKYTFKIKRESFCGKHIELFVWFMKTKNV